MFTTYSISDLFMWPLRVISQLQAHANKFNRFLEHVRLGRVLTTDYSGIQCPEMAIEFLHNACRHTISDTVDLPAQTVTLWRYCDMDEACQEAALRRQHRSEHIFSDISDRLLEHVQGWFESLDPDSFMNKFPREECIKRYTTMRDYLKENASVVYKDAVAPCRAHGTKCPVQPLAPFASEDGCRPTYGNIAGSTCRGWSMRGLRHGDADPSARPFWVWGMEKQVANEDFVFHECTVRHRKDNLRFCLPSKYRLFFLSSDPKHLGWPVRRPRAYCFAMNQETLEWTGPENEDDMQQEYNSMFNMVCGVDANVFMVADDFEVLKEARERALLRGVHLAKDAAVESLRFEGLLAPGARQRMASYEREPAWQSTSIADIEQWPIAGSLHPTELPCLVLHGTLWSWSKKRWMVMGEHMTAQGIPLYPITSDPKIYPQQVNLLDIGCKEGNNMAGNGIHLHAFGS